MQSNSISRNDSKTSTNGVVRRVRTFLDRLAGKHPFTAENAWDKLLGDDNVKQFSAGGAASLNTMHQYYNKLVSGDPHQHYLEYFRDQYLSSRKGARIGSFGCGNGHLERTFVSLGFPFSRLDGYELNPRLVESANEKMRDLGVDNVKYQTADLNKHIFPAHAFDIGVFFHSLHHVENLEHCLDQMHQAIKPDGLLLIVDYIGANRLQYSDNQLKIATNILRMLPDHYRRAANGDSIKTIATRQSLRDVIEEDPSEAIRSADIVPELEKRFDMIEYHSLGGSVLNHVFRGIANNFDEKSEKDVVLIRLLQDLEQWHERNGQVTPDFIFSVCAPKQLI
jgi:2-polyprenyl-3-methyl-5-hydroxy-6-metoxy-1,4-benzoquinol methylase